MLTVLFEGGGIVVVDKPAGLPVHAGPRGGASVEDFFPMLSRRREGPWLAHRLDADTAGCLVVAVRKRALLAAQACFAEGRAEKVYWAVVEGGPAGDEGVVEGGLRKVSGPGGWRMVVDAGGQRAVTGWRLMGRGAGVSWLALWPRTGRTHQVRVHCAALGCPVVGDGVYGRAGRLQLLARSIRLPMEPGVAAEAGVPGHMVEGLRGCGWG